MNEHEYKEARLLFVLSDQAIFHEHAQKKIIFRDQISQMKTNMNTKLKYKIPYMNKNFLYG